ncbi:MAG TPA: thioredoxin-like domain-containing protein [Myxococcales bacterium]|nr:thioredoxin-like domain-containing protein [Myxococcales bacterium]
MRERIHAPDLTSATAWLNADRPLSIRDLRGQVVVLDFWTYCCINCMHVLPVLRDLEERHAADPLVVIGVHSAKFDAEKDDPHILAAMRRYGVSHPVAVDSEMRIWSAYAVRSWPTLVVIRPDGTLAAVAPGEPDPAVLEAFVQRQLDEGRASGTLAREPFHAARRSAEPELPLLYPGKVAVGNERIWVADSGHHRVLALDSDGVVRETIGSGLRGFREGPFAACALDDPQGLAVQGDALFIADARAHVVARADLRGKTLSRVAGTGELGRAPLLQRSPALETALRSPWDVAIRGSELYVALAGSHQVARVEGGFIEPLAGNGREAQIDGPGLEAAMAQPSGLSLQGDVLYVADSESSGVRAIDLKTRKIYSLCGGPGLFDFGDKTGKIEPGMLQHPLAVAATRSSGLLVADTYNDKLKRFSPDGLRLEPFYSGELEQPGGLAVLPDGQVLVADTNHHRLMVVSADGARARELPVSGAPEPQRGAAAAAEAPQRASGAGWFTALLDAPAGVGLAPGDGKLLLELAAPEGFELSEGAPFSVALEVSRRSDLLHVTPELARGQSAGGRRQGVELRAHAGHDADVESELIVTVRTVACDARDHAACWPVQNSFRVPLRLLAGGQAEVRFILPLELPK